ncbi:MAG: LbtU family siderophore porin, partial [Deltaproteobacteria bacterium]
EESVLEHIEDTIHIHGLLEFGAAYQSTDMNVGGHQHDSDLSMTTVEVGIGAQVNDWVSAETILIYEDPSGAIDLYDGVREETNFDVEEAIITIANADVTPAFLKAGKMFVPFGALLTHFPDDMGIDSPLTLLLGETNEKALLIGAEYAGITFSGYVFNGDVEEMGGGEDNVIESYGFDASYAFENETQGMDMLVGASYISNIADSDWIEEMLHHHGAEIVDYAGAAAAYLHYGFQGLFFDAEYMAATDHVDTITTDHDKPAVWNFEAGYNYNWWRNLEIALNYAGSDDCGFLGLPRDRYGINFNQEIFDNTILSVGYLYDEYEGNDGLDRNTRDLLFSQLAVEF